jgi:flagellar biosynthetic protein FliR
VLEDLAAAHAIALPSELAYAFLLVYARLGTASMLLPGLGELWVPARVRLAMGLALTLVTLPTVLDRLPPLPGSVLQLGAQVGIETLIGFFLGFCVRAVTVAMVTAGSLIAMQSGLANALAPGVVSPDATTTVASFLGLAVIAFVVSTGLDHVILRAVVASYGVLPPPSATLAWPPLDQLALTVARIVADGFALGFQIALPFLVATLLLNLGMGLANRFMPSLQVYFLSVPIAIALTLGLLALAVPSMLGVFQEGLLAALARLGGGG